DKTSEFLLEKTSSMSGRLQDHDPRLLSHYLSWGKLDVVKYNLSILHRFVKLAVESSRTLSHIPIPLWKLLGDDVETSSKIDYEDLFLTTDESTLQELGVYSKRHSDYLVEHLPLVGITYSDQLVAFIKAFESLEQHRRSMDENGLRFYASACYHIHYGTPDKISSSDYTWAFFSESQDYLVDTLAATAGGKLLWKDARNFGLGFWITEPSNLKKHFETIARNQYWGLDGVHDPVACSLYYFALKKKNVLLGLWKLASHHSEQAQMLKFLANSFEEERWQNAALKNAFALLGKQRYEYAAAFFLLGGKLKDAVNVCMKQLNDPQLAICICRIYEGENGPVLIDLLENSLLPSAMEAGDRWLSCVLWTIAGKRDKAFYSLTRPLESLLPSPAKGPVLAPSTDPDLFLLYKHLQQAYKKVIMASIPQLSDDDETLFLSECVRTYDRLGCPSLALQMIVQHRLDVLPDYEIVEEGSRNNAAAGLEKDRDETSLGSGAPGAASGAIDWGEPETKPASSGIDWGALDEPPKSTGLDWGELDTSHKGASLDWNEMDTAPTGGLDFGGMKSVFDEEPQAEESVQEAVVEEPEAAFVEKSSVLQLTASGALQLLVRHLDVNIYKKFLIMRLLHEVHNSASLVQQYAAALASDSVLSDYFGYLRKGIRALSEVGKLQIDEIGNLLAARSKEMCALSAYIEILPIDENLEQFLGAAESLFVTQARFLSARCFETDFSQHSPKSLQVIDDLSRGLLQTWNSWQRKCKLFGVASSPSVNYMVLVSGFLIQLAIATIFKRTHRLWWILGLSEQFFDFLLKDNFIGLVPIIEDILTDRPPIAHPNDVQEESTAEIYDEYGIPLFQKESREAQVAEKLLHALVLSHILGAFKVFLDRLAEVMNINPQMDPTFGFLTHSLEKQLSVFVFYMHLDIAERWNRLGMSYSKMQAYLFELNVSELWSLLLRTADSKKAALAIFSTKKPEREGSSYSIDAAAADQAAAEDTDDDTERARSHLILASQQPILSFAINPLDRNQLAYVTSKAINEIDAAASSFYFGVRPATLTSARQT
ncbi:regulator of (H+)-ATPase in vacuolar membrane, partial [Kappamyces sp. JEL0680]